MAKRKKRRTHVRPGSQGTQDSAGTSSVVPRTFVVKHGAVGKALGQLVRDVRQVLEPNTATRLRERTRNKLKDYITLAPALGVSHLLAFTLTDVAPSLRVVRLPAGPTLSFRIERYSLCRDIQHASRHARTITGVEYLSPPLLVLASFPRENAPKHLALVQKTFQSVFPSLSPKTLALSACRRVVLISYSESTGTLHFRHYTISVRPCGVSRRVRRVVDGGSRRTANALPDLGRETDVADFLLREQDAGYESATSAASSAAGDDDDAAVSLADDYVGRNNRKGSRKAVKLQEIGPRMELRLIKITDSAPGKDGAVLYHEFVKKSKNEAQAQQAAHAAKEKLRRQRREEQERNVERKRQKLDKDAEEDEDSDIEGDAENEGEWYDEAEVSDDEENDSDDEPE